MKDYSLGKDQQRDYLLDFDLVKSGEEETYDITFADGKRFGRVVASEENLKKIEEIQEAQAANGVANKHVFVSRRAKSGVLTAGSAVLSAAAGFGLTSAITSMGLLDGTGITFAVGVGVITILGTIPAFAKFMKDRAKVKELEKIEYRDEHKAQLTRIGDYANSLNGVSQRVVGLIEEEENPFSILNIDSFTQEDLEAIIDNMDREDKSGLQYSKTK